MGPITIAVKEYYLKWNFNVKYFLNYIIQLKLKNIKCQLLIKKNSIKKQSTEMKLVSK